MSNGRNTWRGATRLLGTCVIGACVLGGTAGVAEAGTTATASREMQQLSQRVQHASALVDSKQYDQALVAFEAVFNSAFGSPNALDGATTNLAITKMAHLCEMHLPAWSRFSRLRTQIEEGFNNERDLNGRYGWLVLNEVTDAEVATVTWYGKVKSDRAAQEFCQKAAPTLNRVFFLKGMWNEMLSLQDPSDSLAMSEFAFANGNASLAMQEAFGQQAGVLYAACLASGQSREADMVEREATRIANFGTTRLMLVEFALLADEPRQDQQQMLAEALRDRGADREKAGLLQQRLTTALER